jgi:predicted nuclease of predicted toxin-antitoxin system
VRLLLNENMPGAAVRALREHGHDVLAVKESLRGAADTEILARAQVEHRLVVTQDKDFGALAFQARLPAGCGVVLFRLDGASPTEDTRRILEVLESDIEWAGCFAVVDATQVRLRPLPPPLV